MISVEIDADIPTDLGPKAVGGVRDYLEAGADRGFATYVDTVPVDKSTLLDNSFEPTWEGKRLVYGTRDVPYAQAQDKGTAPFTPPITPLLEWGERVLGSRSAGAAVWQHIREEGIEGKHFSRAARAAQRKWYSSHDVQQFIDRRLE